MILRKGDQLLVVVFLLIGLITIGYWWYNNSRVQQGNVAILEINGKVIEKFDLNKIHEPYTVETELGKNVLVFEQGMVRVVEADCPDQICVSFGWAKRAGQSIVCLPHRVVVKIMNEQSDSGLDGVTY